MVGRSFYMQILSKKQDLEATTQNWWNQFLDVQKQFAPNMDTAVLEGARLGALKHVGADEKIMNPFSALVTSFVGDRRLLGGPPKTAPGLPENSRFLLMDYALSARRRFFLEPFQQLMGYWHAFHLPFAIFMYVAAVIHIVTALLFGVSK